MNVKNNKYEVNSQNRYTLCVWSNPNNQIWYLERGSFKKHDKFL